MEELVVLVGIVALVCFVAFCQWATKAPHESYVRQRAGEALRQRDYDLAIAICDAALAEIGSSAEVLRFRAEGYYGKRELRLALTDITEAIRLAPKDGGLYYARGTMYLRVGQPEHLVRDIDEAISDFTHAIRLEAREAESYLWRGVAYAAKGQYEMAFASLQQAITLGENTPTAVAALCERGRVYLALGQREAAKIDFLKAAEPDPNGEGPRRELESLGKSESILAHLPPPQSTAIQAL